MSGESTQTDSEQMRATIHALIDRIWDNPAGYKIDYTVSLTDEVLTISRGECSIFSLLAGVLSK